MATNPTVVVYNYGFAGPVGANPSPRQNLPAANVHAEGGGVASLPVSGGRVTGVLQFDDNRTYSLRIDDSTPVATNSATGSQPAEELAIQGADERRPYVLVFSQDATHPRGAANLTPAVGPPRTVRIEGVWLGSQGDVTDGFVIERASSGDGPDWDEITIRETTLDPGGIRGDGTVIAALGLLIKGRVRTLRIEQAIVGTIEVFVDPDDCTLSGSVEELIITDSIVDAGQNDTAIKCSTGSVTMNGVTVFGDVKASLLIASNSLVMGQLHVTNREESCFRFSAAFLPSEDSSFPRIFHPPKTAPTAANPNGTIIAVDPIFFTSRRFGDPGYAELSLATPPQIVMGAEDGSEMGAFSFLRRPIKLRSVQAKVDEFKPAGVIAQYIFEGEHPEPAPSPVT